MRKSAIGIAWIFLGILAISAAVQTLGKRDAITDPRIDAYGASGFSAFADLLRANGYDVAATSSPIPNLSKNDVVVACLDESESERIAPDSTGIFRVVSDFAQGGGRVILLPVNPDFGTAAEPGEMQAAEIVNDLSGEQRRVWRRTRATGDLAMRFLPNDLVSITLWRLAGMEDTAYSEESSLSRAGNGLVLCVADGYAACNRFIDREQNADVLMSLVATVAPKGSRIVFTEGTYSKTRPGLIDLLGPGAAGIWYQSLFLFVVVVFTLGKRFGLPEESRARQSGQRDLVDAIADTYRRARSTRVACRAAYDRADIEVRKAVRVAVEAPASERDARIPPSLAEAFRHVFEGTIDDLSPAEALTRCQTLRRGARALLKR